jgi:hypothetical protein
MDKITYLQFNGKDFTDFITFVKSMNSRDKTKYARVAVLNVEDGKLVCRANDDSNNMIEYNVELYETDNMIMESIAASVTDLVALVKSSYSEKFTIRKCHGQFEFNVIGGGWMPFKTSDTDITKYTISGDESEIGKINSAKLRNAISSVLGYTQEYTYARDKYIQFSKTQMAVTSRLSSVVMRDDFVEMTLHRDDATMLRSLLKDNFDLAVSKLSGAVGRMLFTGPKFKFSTIETGIETSQVKYIDNINNYITVDGDELYKLVSFSEEYSASKHIVGMSVKDGKLNISIKNVLAAKHNSTVRSTAVGDVEDMSKEADVPSHNLLKALKLFQDKHSREINIYISDKMLSEQNNIIIFDNNTQAIINIYNR